MAPRVNEGQDVEDVFRSREPFLTERFSTLTVSAPTPPPLPTQHSKEEYAKFFQQWNATLKTYMDNTLPGVLNNMSIATLSTFQSALRAVVAARTVQQDAERVLDELQKANAAPEVVDAAKKNVQDAISSVQDSTTTSQMLANTTIFQPHLDDTLLSPSWDDTYFLFYMILQLGGTRWADGCCSLATLQQAQQFLTDTVLPPQSPLVRAMMAAGGPANGQFARAWRIYQDIAAVKKEDGSAKLKETDVQVLQRLHLAVALEHAEPIAVFGTNSHFIDPIDRYRHYRQAYLCGDLDGHFPQFNVWELRHIVDSDASNEELQWGRQSLLAYRPDIVLSTDPSWNYCQIVRTDVAYATPDWYKSPRTYDQILSGGGKCGPRAWYGRFICKAFGIPTWGVRQPGHAAMTRWTSQGWEVCLGGGLWKSWWNDQGGLDFLLETQARQACANEHTFLQTILRLQWLAQYYYRENSNEVRRNGQYDPNNPWYTLGMMQRQRLARKKETGTIILMISPPKTDGSNKIEKMRVQQQQVKASKEVIATDQAGVIVIPATSCNNPSNKNVQFMPCFLGGQQLYVKEDAELEYSVAPPPLQRADGAVTVAFYNFSCRVATAHRSEQPIELQIGANNYAIPLPYTMALWGTTEPVRVDLNFAAASPVVFSIKRVKQNFGFAFKDIQLTPL